MRILLVEDHTPLAELVSEALERAGFTVDHADNANAAIEMSELVSYALVLLDLGLPDMDGLTLLPRLRGNGRLPVIVLTARDQLSDRIAGLDGGADDYVVKPVKMPELVARCRAVLRRPGERAPSVLTLGQLQLDTTGRTAQFAGTPIALARREVTVLEYLMRASGRVATRRALEEAVYGFDDDIGPNALEASVSRLRRALAAAGFATPIITVRGVGWMLPREEGT